MNKLFKYIFGFLAVMALAVGVLFFVFVYEAPIDEAELAEFLENKPIIDIHVHATKGYENNPEYNHLHSNIDLAKIAFMSNELTKHNVVLAYAGGSRYHAAQYMEQNERFQGGLIFPCMPHVTQEQPCEQTFYNYQELQTLYATHSFKFLGESMYNYYGIPPTDKRLDDYWQFAADHNIPVGVHADSGPPSVDETEMPNYRPDFADPILLLPILKKHPNLKIWLMHYGGEYSDNAIKIMQEYPQVYCDMSAVTLFMPKLLWEGNIKKLFDLGLGNRLMFGSDYPGTIEENIKILYGLDWLSAQQKRDVLYNNAARFLDLKSSH